MSDTQKPPPIPGTEPPPVPSEAAPPFDSAPVVLPEPPAAPAEPSFTPIPAEPAATEVPQVALPGTGMPAFWKPLIAPGEQVLWWGEPAPTGRGGSFIANFAAPVFFIVIGLSIAQNSGGGLGTIIGLIFAALSAGLLVQRKRSRRYAGPVAYYLLTDRQASIARPMGQFRKPQIESWPIDARTRLRLAGNGVYFAERRITDRDRGVKVMPVGFTGLSDAEHVYQLFRQIQTR